MGKGRRRALPFLSFPFLSLSPSPFPSYPQNHEASFTDPEKQIAQIIGEMRMGLVEAENEEVRERIKMKNGIQTIVLPPSDFPWLICNHIFPPPLSNLVSTPPFSSTKKNRAFPF